MSSAQCQQHCYLFHTYPLHQRINYWTNLFYHLEHIALRIIAI